MKDIFDIFRETVMQNKGTEMTLKIIKDGLWIMSAKLEESCRKK